MKFTMVPEDAGFFTIKDVPIFMQHSDRGFPCDDTWMKTAIENHQKYAQDGWRPPIIIGHNRPGVEKEAYGFLDGLKIKGKLLYADLVRIPRAIARKIKQNAWPSRSVEVLPGSKRIIAMAMLGGTAPHFALPQTTYESDEQSSWYRSPDMDSEKAQIFTDEERTELYNIVGESVASVLPVVFQEMNDQYYAIAPGVAQRARTAAAGVVDRARGVAKSADVLGRRIAGRTLGVKGGGSYPAKWGRIGTAGKRLTKEQLTLLRANKGKIAASAAGAGIAAGVGTGVGLATRKKQEQEYALGEDFVLYDDEGYAVGEVVPYAEHQVGEQVSTAPDPTQLLSPEDDDPNLTVSETDVGVDSGLERALENEPGNLETDLIEEIDRENSPQFAEQETAETYEMHRRIETLERANSLLQAGRQAEALEGYLLELKNQGVPIDDVEKTVQFMMTLDNEQLTQYQERLENAPRVQLGTMNEGEAVMNFDNRTADLKQDYAQNKKMYNALGVKEQDLQYAGYVRSGPWQNK